MSVQNYLETLAFNAKISDKKMDEIKTSINWLISGINNHNFNIKVLNVFCFGSYDRKTLLPRKQDSYSDVDIMIVFNNENDYQPQTLLDKLKSFVINKYPNSLVKQAFPAIKLELKHINFDLVPAIEKKIFNVTISGYKIPASPNNIFLQWIDTDPNDFKKRVEDKHSQKFYKIKPLIRLMKLWNSKNDKPLKSFELENYIINKNYLFNFNAKDFFFSCVENISSSFNDLAAAKKDKLQRLENFVKEIKNYEKSNCPYLAEEKCKEIFE